MPALVESMYSTREKPWHGLGIVVKEAPTSEDALRLAGLDWNVVQEPIYTPFREKIEGFKANVRDTDRRVLGVVSDRYKVVQNVEAFSFTDELLGNGVRYETAGSLSEGRRVWLLARLPREYIIAGERISPYLVFSNTHDGSGSVKVAITPVRVVCNNTLNLALNTAQRSFSMIHTGNIADKIQEARDTLFMAENYMDQLGAEFEQLRKQKITEEQVKEYIELLLPMEKNPTKTQEKNILRLREDMTRRYYDAPDLKHVGNNAYRFINAVSDFATHAEPLRRTANFNENLFSRTIDGNPLIDRAYQLIKAAA
jgi:phage/plasmid-like protein (TIGR03299 family)